jgi:hypothetical protein
MILQKLFGNLYQISIPKRYSGSHRRKLLLFQKFKDLTIIYLGLWNEIAYFAVDVTNIPEDSPLFAHASFLELRTIAPNMTWEGLYISHTLNLPLLQKEPFLAKHVVSCNGTALILTAPNVVH